MKKILFALLILTVHANAQWQWAVAPDIDTQDNIGNSRINSLATTNAGITYAAGSFISKMTFQGYELKAQCSAPQATPQAPFIIKYDSDGKVIWALSIAASLGGTGNALAIDKEENVYLTGTFTGELEFNAFTKIKATKEKSLFVAKYDKNGSFLWAKTAGSLSPNGIAVDGNSGYLYITGTFTEQQYIERTNLSSFGGVDIFIAKYDSLGNFLWAQNAGTTGYDSGNGIAVDGMGNVLVTGGVSKGFAQFGNQTISNVNGNWISAFLSKYKPDGSLSWVRIESSVMPSDKNVSMGNGVVADDLNYYYITGSFNNNLKLSIFDPNLNFFTQLTANNDKDIFVAAYSADGILQWAKQAGGSSSAANSEIDLLDDEALAISIDKSGKHNVLITGFFESDCLFDNQKLVNTGDKDIFVAAYDCQSGTLQYALAVGSDDSYSSAVGYGISNDALGNFYLGGRFNTDGMSAMNFGSISLPSNEGVFDAYLAKYHLSDLVPNLEKPVARFPGR